MIPVLYESKETNFITQGLGALTDAISCYVTEERNGIYELEMEYPQTGVHFDDIQNGNIIMAIPSPYRDAQPFRIYKVTKPLNGNVTVYANHISYDLNKIPVNPLSATTVSSALSGIKNNMQIQNNFLFWTDKTTAADFSSAVPTACRSLLGGQEGSILDVYGGEYEWDRFTVRLHNQRGEDSGVVIRYGKNLTGLNQEGDITNLVTGICPYWYSDGTLVMCNPPIIYRDGMTAQSAIPVDMTDKFEEAPSQAQLQEAAENYIESNDIGEPSVSITVEFVQLAQMSGYEHLALLEKCDLCDTVKVQYEEAGIDVTAKIVSIQTDVLLEKYESMEIGSIRANIAQTIADQQAQISQIGSSSMLQQAIQNATNWITGGRGGYVIFQLNEDGQPDEILIMDTPSIETAQKVWRWNQGGLGYSKNGYDGPYETAITQDGAIVADFITAGTMMANIIKGGTLTMGGPNNGNGVCRVLDANGNEVIRLDNAGIKILKGLLQIGTLFSVDTAGNVVANRLKSSNAEITGGNINIETESDDYSAIMLKYGAYVLSLSASMMQVYEASNPERHASLYCGSGGSGGSLGLGYQTGSEFFIVNHANLWYSGPTAVFEGDLHVYGNKNRVVKTDKYGERALNAYETTEAWFGDIGSGEISDDGKCTIEIDRIFAETVKLDDYVVFLQAEGPGECYINEKNANSFVVTGSPGLRFVYEIKAKQKGFENVRLEEYKERKA